MDRNHPSHPSPLRSTSLETINAAAVVMCAQVLVMFFSRRSSPTMFIWFLQKIALSTQRCHHTLHSHQLRLLPPIAALAPLSFPRSFSSSLHHSQGPLDETTSKKLLVKLNQEILKHDELYYNQAMPLIPDHEYDQLLNQAQDIVNKYPKLKPFFTKSDRVGSVVDLKDESQSYVHSFPMLSLDNTFDEKGLLKFIGDIQSHCSKNNLEYPSLNFTFEPKIDGVSLSLKYVGGKLTSAGTRGDGKIGEAVPHVSSILDIPSSLSTPSSSPSISLPWTDPSVEIEIRGEVYMTDKDFDEVQTKCSDSNSKQFSTPRNTVAGTIRSHDPEITSQRKLRFIAYGFYLRNTSASDSAASDNGSWSRNLIPCSSNSMQLPLQSQTLELLSNLGFVTPTGWINLSVPLRDNTQLSSALALVLQQCQLAECRRSQIGYDTDGVVLKLNDVSLQEQLGFRSRSPKWAIAFKFVPKSAITKLLNIEIQVGRTGILTPVAHLSPVVIGGVKIERATLHNQQEITRLGIQPGQYVRVQRSGDVIPKIIEGIHPSSLAENSVPASETSQSPFQFPKVCPVCQSPVIVTASKSGDPDSVSHRCSGGYACQAQIIEKLKFVTLLSLSSPHFPEALLFERCGEY
jgi:DNA ligase (NAD+)